MNMKIKIASILAVIILSMTCISCDKDDNLPRGYYPLTTYCVNMVSIDGEDSTSDVNLGESELTPDGKAAELTSAVHHITVKLAGLFFKERINSNPVFLSPEEFGLVESMDPLDKIYNTANIECIAITNGESVRPQKIIKLERVDENTYEADGFTVKKYVENNEILFGIDVPENMDNITRKLTIYLMHDTEGIYNPISMPISNVIPEPDSEVYGVYNTCVNIVQESKAIVKV